ncbi:hypothetical protein [Cycloclasticus pugetii]|uniref:hypothetical protein n=1 Tax=Cycloclasticus pugetii TaxID=34068 RepID=UPI003A8E7035
MRWLGRGLLVLILLIALVSLYQKIPAKLWSPFSDRSAVRNLPEETRATKVFWLSQDDWLTYSLQGKPDLVRILNHAQLTADQYGPDDEVKFGIHYRVLDKKNRVLKEKDYLFRTTILHPRRLENGQTFPARFYADPSFIASADQVLFIDLRALPDAASIELKAIELPPGGHRIGVRAAQREFLSGSAAALKWQRVSEDARAEEVEAHVYPHYLVSTFEVLNQLTRRWLPIGPTGVEGESFLSDSLYLLNAESSPEPKSEVAPAGLKADSRNWVTLPIPGPGVRNYRLEFTPLDAAKPITIGLSHQANTDLEVNHFTVRGAPENDALSWSAKLAPGLLQVIADQPVSIRLVDPETNDDITSQRQLLPGFNIGPTAPLSYRLNPDTGGPQPVRLDFRAVNHPELGVTDLPATVSVQFYDTQQALLEQFQTEVTPIFGPYQRFSSEDAARLSESESLYTRAPENAATVTVTSETPLLVTLYSRVANMPVRRILSAQQRPWEDYENRLTSWFINQPIDAEDLLRQGRRSSIVWFFKPIELNPALEEGNYAWEALEPATPVAQKRVLFPHETNQPIRETALPNLYQQIGRSAVQVELQASVPGVPVSPRLIFSRNTARPASIRVYRDGQLWLKRGIAGKRGSFSLPVVAAGRYELRIEGDGDWFINHSPSGRTYLQRLAYSLDGKTLSFDVDKQTAKEVVSFQLFMPSQSESYQISVTVSDLQRNSGLQTDYTLTKREYTLQGHPDTTLGIQGDGRNWSEPYRFAVPLGDDIPNGTYTINLTPSSSGGALVAAFRILEGQQAPFRFFKEARSDQ